MHLGGREKVSKYKISKVLAGVPFYYQGWQGQLIDTVVLPLAQQSGFVLEETMVI